MRVEVRPWKTDKGVHGDAGRLMSVPLYQAKAEFFKTLGHPARIRILELLSEREYPVHELLENIAIEPSNLSQQLAVLRRASLVISHRQGGEVTYSISAPEVRDLLLAARQILFGTGSCAGRGRAAALPCPRAMTDWLRGAWSRTAALLPRREDWTHARPRRDLMAGLMVGLVALPLALGFGVSSGMGAGAGLITAVVAGTLAAVFGGSRVQVSGPTGAMTVVLVPIIATYGPDGVLVVGVLAGLILIGLGYAGAGRFIRYVPVPVVEGFTVGIAAIIALQQLPAALGVDVHAENVLVLARNAIEAWAADPTWITLGMTRGGDDAHPGLGTGPTRLARLLDRTDRSHPGQLRSGARGRDDQPDPHGATYPGTAPDPPR